MNINTKKKLVAQLSILSNIILTTLKIVAGILSGSISIISEAIHSASDLFASFLTFFSVVKSSEPADADHPYGHGKYEDMAGFIEGLLIVFAAFYIIYKSITKIVLGIQAEHETYVGIAVMAIAVVMNFLVSSLLFKVAKESDSVSLYADGEHLRTDIYSSAGVLFGLILIKATGYVILDPIIAIFIAVFIYNAGYSISKKSMRRLLDFSLPNEDIERIKKIIKSFANVVKLKENSIKARQTGTSKNFELVLLFPESTSICDCHKICEEIETQIRMFYTNCTISIHSEPDCYSQNCKISCVKNNP